MVKKDTEVVENLDDEKQKEIELSLKLIAKQFGEGLACIASNEDLDICTIKDWIPMGLPNLDYNLSKGRGLPRGRHIELYGWEATGKSSLALHACAQAQKQGLLVAYIDSEHALELDYAQKLEVDLNRLTISQPDYGEQALDIAETLCRTGSYGLIIIDSVATLIPKAELDGTMEDQQMGLQARMMSKALRKLNPLAQQANCTFIWINQFRQKIGISYGSPDVVSGGNALKFYATIRLELRKGDWVGPKETPIGFTCKIKTAKNKVFTPFRTAEVDLLFGQGFSPWAGTVDLLRSKGILENSGAWYYLNGTKVAQGRNGMAEYLATMPPEELKLLLDRSYGLTTIETKNEPA